MIINVKNFTNQIGTIKNELKNYEFKIYEASSIISNMHFYWSDGYTNSFFKRINKFTQDINDLTDYLHHIVSCLDVISIRYNSINNRIDDLFGNADAIIDSNNYIVYEDDKPEIAERKYIVSDIIDDSEDQIASTLFKSNNVYVSTVNYDSLDVEKTGEQNTLIGMMDNMPNEIKKLEEKNRDVYNTSNYLKESLISITTLYNSKNVKKLKALIDIASENMHFINNNLRITHEYIISRREQYQNLFSKMAADARNIDKDWWY